MKMRLPKGTFDLEGILMLGLVAAVLLMDAFAACAGEPAGDALGESESDAALTGIHAMSLESYSEAVRTLSSDARSTPTRGSTLSSTASSGRWSGAPTTPATATTR